MPKIRMTPLDKLIGARIRAQRVAADMSQADLAAGLQISYQQLQKYETGENRVSASGLHQIARALQAPIISFFEEPAQLAAE